MPEVRVVQRAEMSSARRCRWRRRRAQGVLNAMRLRPAVRAPLPSAIAQGDVCHADEWTALVILLNGHEGG